MEKIDSRIRNIAIISFAILMTAQVFFIFWFHGVQQADSACYLAMAKHAAATSSWYPNTANLPEQFFFGVGYVNMLSWLFRITTDVRIAFFLNLIFTLVTLFSGAYITKKLFNSDRICYLFIIIFCLMCAFWGEVVSISTDLPYTAFAFLAIACLVSEKKYSTIMCGVLLALANWIRPLALAFLLAAIIWLLVKKKGWKKIVSMLAGSLIVIGIIGTISYYNCGHFIFQSTTSGVNLVQGANDLADGSYGNEVFQKGNAAYLTDDQKKDMIYSMASGGGEGCL